MRKITLFSLFSLFFLSSCISNLEAIGYKLDQNDINKIQKEKLSKDNIVSMIGSPTITSDVGGESWYYVFYIRDRVGFSYPEIEDIQIIELDFDKSDKLVSLKEFNKDDLNRITADKAETITKGTELNPLYHILQNIQKHSIPVPIQKKKPQT